MEISTNVKTHVIITMQGGHYFINERLNTQLEKMKLDDMLTTPEGAQIKVSTIVEVVPISSYYEQYPEKRPGQKAENWTDKRLNGTGNVFARSTAKGKEIMLKAAKAKYPNAPIVELMTKSRRRTDSYQPDNVFDYKNESWADFKNRTGVSFHN